MEKIDFDQVYYHGLDSANGFSRNTANFTNLKYEISLKRLESILKCKAILSTDRRKKEKIEDIGVHCGVNWNGSKYVSICQKKFLLKVAKPTWILSEAYQNFCQHGISIVLNQDLIKDLPVRQDFHLHMPGEIQIEDAIPTSYMIGLCINTSNEDQNYQDTVKKAKSLLIKYQMEIPIFHLRNTVQEKIDSKKL